MMTSAGQPEYDKVTLQFPGSKDAHFFSEALILKNIIQNFG
jgi:hypothetical protein